MFVIEAFKQTVCVVVALAEVNAKLANGFTVIVPVNDGAPQLPPVAEIVYGKLPVILGFPVIVTTLPEVLKVTPAGNPVTVAPVAVPPNE